MNVDLRDQAVIDDLRETRLREKERAREEKAWWANRKRQNELDAAFADYPAGEW